MRRSEVVIWVSMSEVAQSISTGRLCTLKLFLSSNVLDGATLTWTVVIIILTREGDRRGR